MGWVWTIILALAFTAALFSAGAYAPSIIQSDEIRDYRMALYAEASEIYSAMNKANLMLVNDSAWWNGSSRVPLVAPFNGKQLNATISQCNAAFSKAMLEFDSKKNKFTGAKRYISSEQVLFYFNQALSLQNLTVGTTIGQAQQ